MTAEPYTTLMRFREWATNDLYVILAGCLEGLPEPDRTIVVGVLDHIHTVEDIFRHNLERRPHEFHAPRSDVVPSLGALHSASRAIGAWYTEYTAALSLHELAECIDFTYSNGEAARMTRGQMLLHVAMHGTGHRGNISILLQKNGLQPSRDRLTDFLAATGAGGDGW